MRLDISTGQDSPDPDWKLSNEEGSLVDRRRAERRNGLPRGREGEVRKAGAEGTSCSFELISLIGVFFPTGCHVKAQPSCSRYSVASSMVRLGQASWAFPERGGQAFSVKGQRGNAVFQLVRQSLLCCS